jgi:hypothetical protein
LRLPKIFLRKPVIIFISFGPASEKANAHECGGYADTKAGYHFHVIWTGIRKSQGARMRALCLKRLPVIIFQVTQKPASWKADAGECGRRAVTKTGDHGVRGRKTGGKNKP